MFGAIFALLGLLGVGGALAWGAASGPAVPPKLAPRLTVVQTAAGPFQAWAAEWASALLGPPEGLLDNYPAIMSGGALPEEQWPLGMEVAARTDIPGASETVGAWARRMLGAGFTVIGTLVGPLNGRYRAINLGQEPAHCVPGSAWAVIALPQGRALPGAITPAPSPLPAPPAAPIPGQPFPAPAPSPLPAPPAAPIPGQPFPAPAPSPLPAPPAGPVAPVAPPAPPFPAPLPPGPVAPPSSAVDGLPEPVRSTVRTKASVASPSGLRAIAAELRRDFPAASSELEALAKASEPVWSLEGRAFRIRSGDAAGYLAIHYTGTFSKWRDLADPLLNPGVKVASWTSNGQKMTGLRPWDVGQVIYLPSDWDARKGPPDQVTAQARVAAVQAARAAEKAPAPPPEVRRTEPRTLAPADRARLDEPYRRDALARA